MASGAVHTVHKDGSWVVEVEGGGVLSTHATKAEAVAAGRLQAMARKTEHVIHNEDGTISEKNSYGDDPYPPPG
jgi:hypothetical protein